MQPSRSIAFKSIGVPVIAILLLALSLFAIWNLWRIGFLMLCPARCKWKNFFLANLHPVWCDPSPLLTMGLSYPRLSEWCMLKPRCNTRIFRQDFEDAVAILNHGGVTEEQTYHTCSFCFINFLSYPVFMVNIKRYSITKSHQLFPPHRINNCGCGMSELKYSSVNLEQEPMWISWMAKTALPELLVVSFQHPTWLGTPLANPTISSPRRQPPYRASDLNIHRSPSFWCLQGATTPLFCSVSTSDSSSSSSSLFVQDIAFSMNLCWRGSHQTFGIEYLSLGKSLVCNLFSNK